MRKFKCTICGYTFDETKGYPDKGIAPGTKWEDVPKDYVCPLCGAAKALFEEVQDAGVKSVKKTDEPKATTVTVTTEDHEDIEDLRELSMGEISALFSNLALGCEKQQLKEEASLFTQLSEYYKDKVMPKDNCNLNDLVSMLDTDLAQRFSNANEAAKSVTDRGALRALTWTEKVSRMADSLLKRYAEEGEAAFENTKLYVCDICGFIYIGDGPPEICPVCKVPNFKISLIERR